MDKKNLYYVIVNGTDHQVGDSDNNSFIGNKKTANVEKRFRDLYGISKHEIISIADYEKKFEDDKK